MRKSLLDYSKKSVNFISKVAHADKLRSFGSRSTDRIMRVRASWTFAKLKLSLQGVNSKNYFSNRSRTVQRLIRRLF